MSCSVLYVAATVPIEMLWNIYRALKFIIEYLVYAAVISITTSPGKIIVFGSNELIMTFL